MSEIADNRTICYRLQTAEGKTGVTLTPSNRRFYLRLVEYADRNRELTENGEMVCNLSVQQLSERLRTPIRTTTKYLNLLTDCGAIIRIAPKNKNVFPPLPKQTILPREFWQKG